MKLQVLTSEWPPHVYGGAGVNVPQLCNALAARAELDLVPYLYLSELDGDLAARLGMNLDDSKAVATCAYAARAVSRAIRFQPDVAWSNTWFANLAGLAVGSNQGAAHVVTARSVERARPWKEQSRGREYDFSKWVEESAYVTADAIVAVSESVANDIRMFHPDVEERKINVIYNGIDTDLWKNDARDSYAEEIGLCPGEAFIVYVGRVTRQKGLQYLVRSAAALPTEIGLVIFAGERDSRVWDEVLDGVERLREQGRSVTVLLDVYDPAKVRGVVSRAMLQIVPSIYEPFGVVALEAMACGTPLVAAAVGGLPEFVSPEVGWLFPVHLDDATRLPVDEQEFIRSLSDCLVEACFSSDLAAMGTKARRLAVDRFSWSAIADQYMELFLSLR